MRGDKVEDRAVDNLHFLVERQQQGTISADRRSATYHPCREGEAMGTDHAACYRQRAVDMRKLAARAQSEHLRYLTIARDWDQLAEEAEGGSAATPSSNREIGQSAEP